MTTKKKTILSLITLLVIAGGAWFLWSGRAEVSYKSITPEQASQAVAVLSKDADGDDLKDWEEELWHTDKLKSDTDGDGTTDGEEVKLGRDPTKPGPDDKLDKETIENKTVPGGGSWSETDRVSRELFAKYLSIKQSGKPFTAVDEEALITDLLSRYPETTQSTVYTESDITVSAMNDDAALRAYGNAVGGVIAAHKDGGENELIIFERALQNDDEPDLANLQARAKRYGNILADLKAISVPRSTASTHLTLLNAIAGLKESVEGMSAAFSDSVRALSSAVAYPEAVQNLTQAFTGLSNLLKERGVTFEESEPGVILTN